MNTKLIDDDIAKEHLYECTCKNDGYDIKPSHHLGFCNYKIWYCQTEAKQGNGLPFYTCVNCGVSVSKNSARCWNCGM